MIRLGTLADLPACSGVYRRASLSNAGDRDNLLARVADVLRARGVPSLEVTANPHAEGFYRAAGFTDGGVAETVFGTSPRKRLMIASMSGGVTQRARDGFRGSG